jgi:hypothetical protein
MIVLTVASRLSLRSVSTEISERKDRPETQHHQNESFGCVESRRPMDYLRSSRHDTSTRVKLT